MSQGQCLALPRHWTHEGICYPGANASIQLHGLTLGGATSVPEPSTAGLFALALILGALFWRIRQRGSTNV